MKGGGFWAPGLGGRELFGGVATVLGGIEFGRSWSGIEL